MNLIPFTLLAMAILASSACANPSTAQRRAYDPPEAAEIAASPASSPRSSDEPPDRARTTAEFADDAAVVRDPWERYNRGVYGFNNAIDKVIFRPLAIGYDKVVPDVMQSGVSRFFDNLNLPATAANQTLQARPIQALRSLGRFAVNSTVGIGGLLDPASHFGIPEAGNEDFGQTLAAWGWRDSRYLVMPLLGPRTVRDAVALVGDRVLSPLSYVGDSNAATGLQLLKIVDLRARLLPMDQARRDAYDEYALVRDTWAQRRKHQIERNRAGDAD